MKRHFEALWQEAGGTGPAPGLRSRDIRRRVNTALGRRTGERMYEMKRHVRILAAAAAITALLACSAVAAGNWNVLSAYFRGDTAPGVGLLDETVRRVEDENYILTVESSASDGELALLLVRVEAKNSETANFLNSDDFNSIDTWSFQVLGGTADESGSPAPAASGFSYGEVKELRTETSRTWQMSADLTQSVGELSAQVRLGYMEEGQCITVPLSRAEPITVKIGAEGPGMGTLFCLEGGPVVLETAALSPFRLSVTYRCADGTNDLNRPDVPLFFLFRDGTLLTRAQMIKARINGQRSGQDWELSFRLRSVLDLDTLEAVVFDDTAYPLDGGEPYACPVDETLYSFQLPLEAPLGEGMGYSIPVEALCEGLGAGYDWDEETQTAVMVYRDVEIVLTVGSTTALVDGQPMELEAAPALREGRLVCEHSPFDEWQIDLCVACENYVPRGESNQPEAWLVVP